MSWQQSTLGEECELYQPQTLAKNELDKSGVYKVYGANGVIGTHSKFNHEDPQLLVTCRGATCGTINISEAKSWINGNAMVVKPRSSNIDLYFLSHYLHHLDISKAITGAAQPQITRQSLAPIKIQFPPLAQQQRIATVLEKAAEIKAKREQAIAKLDELAQSAFVEMFGDPIKNSKGWEIVQLEKIANIGSSKRVFVEELTETGVPFYRGTEIGALGAGELIEPSLFISKAHYERLKLEGGVPKKGDLLLPSICQDGRIYLVEDDNQFYFKDGRVLWIGLAGEDVNPYFLRGLLKEIFAKNYSKIASGTTFAELKIFALKQLSVIKPPSMLQSKYGDFIKSLNAEYKKLDKDLRKLKELIASLQHQAFTTGFNA